MRGKVPPCKCTSFIRGDHPRVCGEKISSPITLPISSGSPPRMRGKDISFEMCLFSFGITPAYAGKSQQLRQLCQESQDHPRVCGEKGRKVTSQLSELGSPPRMRGKGFNAGDKFHVVGITPAYAGKSILTKSLFVA